MQDFRKTRNARAALMHLAWRSLGLLVLAGLAFLAVRAAWNMYDKFAAASDAQAQVEAQLSFLQSQYNSVETQVQSLSTPRGQEGELRQRYGVVRPGEGEIDIVRQAPTSTGATGPQQSWLEKLWQALFVW